MTVELVRASTDQRDVALPDGPPPRERLAAKWLVAQDSPATITAYRTDIRVFFAWCDRYGVDALRARRHEVDLYRRWLDAGPGGKQLARATRARRLSSLSSFYRHAMQVEEDAVPANPAAAVRRPKVPAASETPHLEVDELRRFFAAADSIDLGHAALTRVLYYSAVRVSELCHATTADLRTVHGVLTLGVIRKGDKPERVSIGAHAAAALRAHLGGRTGPLFLFRGQPINRHQVAYVVAKVASKAGLADRKLTPHGLRHSAATHALEAGEDVARVQQMLGHARVETTMRYAHLSQAVENSPTHLLDRLIEGDL